MQHVYILPLSRLNSQSKRVKDLYSQVKKFECHFVARDSFNDLVVKPSIREINTVTERHKYDAGKGSGWKRVPIVMERHGNTITFRCGSVRAFELSYLPVKGNLKHVTWNEI